jgi:hypothetical protein
MKAKTFFLLGALAGLLLTWNESRAQILLEQKDAAKSVAIRSLTANPTLINGEIVNQTPHIIRDVELLIQFHWLWKNEFKPGEHAPGRTDSHKIDTELKPGEAAAFRYIPNPPLPTRDDGLFEPEVTIGGFTVVIPTVDTTSR